MSYKCQWRNAGKPKIMNIFELKNSKNYKKKFFQNLSKRRRYVAAASLNGKCYIIGGYDGQSRLSLVECLDLTVEDPQWQSVSSMLQRRGLAGVCVYRGISLIMVKVFLTWVILNINSLYKH